MFVGEIVSVNESQTNVVYKVDDHTGPLMDVKKWLDDQELEVGLNLRAECRCEWVHACGGEVCVWSHDAVVLCPQCGVLQWCVLCRPAPPFTTRVVHPLTRVERAYLLVCWASFAPSHHL